jgi:hypothetical protein
MKKLIAWFVILALAIAVRLSGWPRGIDLSWRVDSQTHRGIPLDLVFFWVLIGALGVWVITELIYRFRVR